METGAREKKPELELKPVIKDEDFNEISLAPLSSSSWNELNDWLLDFILHLNCK